MGGGGLNRILLSSTDLPSPSSDTAVIPSTDSRATHIRAHLSSATTLRVALADSFTHDAAPAQINADGSVSISLPAESRTAASALPPVILVVAMQRPRAMGRIFDSVAQIGVEKIFVVAAEKVEKSYWDSKLFRNDGVQGGGGETVGRKRARGCHPERDEKEGWNVERVDTWEKVRKRLEEGIVQAAVDVSVPQVIVDKRGVIETVRTERRENWVKLVLHPRDVGKEVGVTEMVEKGKGGVMLAVGPEGGWTEEEIDALEKEGFSRVGMGERVLRSETAVVVALGLAHEGLRRRANLTS